MMMDNTNRDTKPILPEGRNECRDAEMQRAHGEGLHSLVRAVSGRVGQGD